MNRRTFSLSALAFALQHTLRAQTPERARAEASIYTYVLSNYILSPRCPDPKEHLAVEEMPCKPTAPVLMEKMPEAIAGEVFAADGSSILSPPSGLMPVAHALVHDYKRAVVMPQRIPSNLKLPRPYRLVTALEREQFFLLQSEGPAHDALSGSFKRAFKSFSSILSLSPVAFHPTQPYAMVFCISRTVGSQNTWLYILQGSGEHWTPLPWPSSTLNYEQVS